MHGGVVTMLVTVLTTIPLWVMKIMSQRSSKFEEVYLPEDVSAHLAVEYMGGAKVGDQLFCRCSVDKSGKNIAFLSAELYISRDGKNIPCYKVTHTRMILLNRDPISFGKLADRSPSLRTYFRQSKL